ncbi:MAG: hypothetical protein COV00_03470 [Candidatus Tagabacteria bacterium CG10_big_fil_rev_8_21_14_0_10_40_13]|uniref:Uncharacterized protein n=1 Tax=Candidatus Tagabacteria bacterium CG10_big_fil_rev_8_21_14_0_10_40_13 TaxID=1975022 RepID=A0A2M8L860_9BACT|nr:MAG: hypothetical protein COV00_03470 [Candidatus Tagabacteria bacterium CG10_big_fil_rev_8_21_14_0_10_40_13]
MFNWYFNPKNKYSIIKIPYGILIGVLFLFSLWGSFWNLIDAFRASPLFIGAIGIVIFPLLFVFFAGPILWGSLFYLPYLIFSEESYEYQNLTTGQKWIKLFKYTGIVLIVVIIMVLIQVGIFSRIFLI